MPSVSEILTADVFRVEPTTSITEVALAMVKGRFGSVVVTDGPMILGILTERDVLRATAAGADPTTSTVAEWMTSDPVTIGPETDSDAAAELMLSGGFRHLPVVDASRLIGIVSLRDVLSARIGHR